MKIQRKSVIIHHKRQMLANMSAEFLRILQQILNQKSCDFGNGDIEEKYKIKTNAQKPSNNQYLYFCRWYSGNSRTRSGSKPSQYFCPSSHSYCALIHLPSLYSTGFARTQRSRPSSASSMTRTSTAWVEKNFRIVLPSNPLFLNVLPDSQPTRVVAFENERWHVDYWYTNSLKCRRSCSWPAKRDSIGIQTSDIPRYM